MLISGKPSSYPATQHFMQSFYNFRNPVATVPVYTPCPPLKIKYSDFCVFVTKLKILKDSNWQVLQCTTRGLSKLLHEPIIPSVYTHEHTQLKCINMQAQLEITHDSTVKSSYCYFQIKCENLQIPNIIWCYQVATFTCWTNSNQFCSASSIILINITRWLVLRHICQALEQSTMNQLCSAPCLIVTCRLLPYGLLILLEILFCRAWN